MNLTSFPTDLNVYINEERDLITDIAIPILIAIIGPICIGFKILYDKWDFQKKETLILKNKLILEKINHKLKDFYWPLYILLLKDFDLWSKIIFKNFIQITNSDSESDIEDLTNEPYKTCSYVRTLNSISITCNNPVAINCIDKFGAYCIRHQRFKSLKMLKTMEFKFTDKEAIVEKTENKLIDYDNNINNEVTVDINESSNSRNSDSDSSDSIRSIINDIKTDNSNLPGNITGNLIGEISGLNINTNSKIPRNFNEDLLQKIKKNLIENHKEINKLIINNIAIAEPKSGIGKQLVKYIKFINIFKSQHEAHLDNIDPIKYGSGYPKKLLPLIEIELFKIQKEYNKLVENYYKL